MPCQGNELTLVCTLLCNHGVLPVNYAREKAHNTVHLSFRLPVFVPVAHFLSCVKLRVLRVLYC